MKRLFFALCVLFVCALAPFSGQAASDWPQKTITIIVPFSAGGNFDTAARILIPDMERVLGVNVIIRNVEGAGATIGAAEVAKAKPDGYTLLLAGGSIFLQPLMRKLPYTTDSFLPISRLFSIPYALHARKGGKFKTFEDFLKAAKAAPGEITCSTSGIGNQSHMVIVALCKAFDIKLKVVPTRSGPDGMKDVLGGNLDVTMDSQAYVTFYDSLALVRFAPERSKDPALVDVPAIKEFGKELYFSTWTALVAPKGTPPDIIKKLDDTIAPILELPKFKGLAEKNGMLISYLNVADFQKFLDREVVTLQGLLKDAGLTQ